MMFEDGTNVPAGTDFVVRVDVGPNWYCPADSKATPSWQVKLTTLRARFERIVDECRPVECVLIQKRIPAFADVALSFELVHHSNEVIEGGGGLRLEPTQLFQRDGAPLFGEFAIRDAKGTPICNSAGEPFALRFGLSRQFCVSTGPTAFGEGRSLPGPRLTELSRDAASLLYQLPANVAVSLWRNWRIGFSRRDNATQYLWFDALFELAWQARPGDALYADRCAWNQNLSVRLHGDGLFPRLPEIHNFPFAASIPHDNEHPLAYYSKISDVARASVAAIDEILERATTSIPLFPPQPRPPTATSESEPKMTFHVFLSHNSKDKPAVRDLKQQLLRYSLTVWFDEDELQPGIPWQQLLEHGVTESDSIAVLIGKDGLGPWEDEEMQAALRLAVADKRPVIPVLMPGAASQPKLPLFLGNRTWVDLRAGLNKDGLDRLVWGITGTKPNP